MLLPVRQDEKPWLKSQLPKLLSGIATYCARVVLRLSIKAKARRSFFIGYVFLFYAKIYNILYVKKTGGLLEYSEEWSSYLTPTNLTGKFVSPLHLVGLEILLCIVPLLK
jgi:hypothetical protein